MTVEGDKGNTVLNHIIKQDKVIDAGSKPIQNVANGGLILRKADLF